MGLPILTNIYDRNQFVELLKANPGLVIIKFGAEWCGPCKLIENDVMVGFRSMPDTVQCVIVDIDKSFDLYAFLKTKRMVNGVPVVLCYKKGNTTYIPDDAISGANVEKLRSFFDTCRSYIEE
jgi:hypothetical protein